MNPGAAATRLSFSFAGDGMSTTTKTVSPELAEQLRRDRELIAAERDDLERRHEQSQKAAAENTLCGHLRRAIHKAGRPLKAIAADAGLDPFELCDWLEGTRSLSSEMLDRIAAAADVVIQFSPKGVAK